MFLQDKKTSFLLATESYMENFCLNQNMSHIIKGQKCFKILKIFYVSI